MRFAGGVADARPALGEDSGHDRVLGAHHRRLVEVQPLAAEPVRSHLVGAVELDIGTELLERVNVGVEPSSADDVAARRRNRDAPEARQQRSGEEEGRADLARKLGVEVRSCHSTCVDPNLVRAGPFDVCTEVGEQLDHRLDVANARHVRQAHLLGGEHARGEDRKRAVLVARGPHRAAQRPAALDDEGLHGAGNATRGLHGIPFG